MGREIPEDVFFEYVLPFANLNEKRESWRKDFTTGFQTSGKLCYAIGLGQPQ